jgi:hypothetical protein
MRHAISTGAVLLLFLVSAVFADDEKKDKSSKKPDAPASQTEKKKEATPKKFVSAKPFAAKLLRVDPAQKTFSVEITIARGQENLDAARNLISLRQQLLTTRDPGSIRNIQVEILKNQANLYSRKDEKQKIELEAIDDMRVRTTMLPLETDEKGRPRKLTEKEKRELKGPETNLKGYMADFENLKAGQIVEVYLEKPSKGAAQHKPKDLVTAKERPKVVMMVILEEPPNK